MNILEKLFGSEARVKLLRLFFLNSERVFTPKEISKLSKVNIGLVSKELRVFINAGFIKQAWRTDEIKKTRPIRVGLGPRMLHKKVKGVILLPTFPLLLALHNLLITASPVSRERMLKYFKRYGKIKLVGLGGVFLDIKEREFSDLTSSLDLVLVADGFKKNKFENFIHQLESEIGRELNWALFSINEFDYRLAMHDKFLRDFLDYPHEFLINKLGIK